MDARSSAYFSVIPCARGGIRAGRSGRAPRVVFGEDRRKLVNYRCFGQGRDAGQRPAVAGAERRLSAVSAIAVRDVGGSFLGLRPTGPLPGGRPTVKGGLIDGGRS